MLSSSGSSIEPAQGVGGPQARGAPAAERAGQQAARQGEPHGEQHQLQADRRGELHGHRLRGLAEGAGSLGPPAAGTAGSGSRCGCARRRLERRRAVQR